MVQLLAAHIKQIGISFLRLDARDLVQIQERGDGFEGLEGLHGVEFVEVAGYDDGGVAVFF
jgi:hypothetical protein